MMRDSSFDSLYREIESLRKRLEALETKEAAATIAAGSVTNTMLANMAQSTIKGRASGAGTGDPTDLSASQVAAIVNGALDHTALTNIGTNTHAAIDTALSTSSSHIAATAAHGATGAVVGTTNTQQLDNKTLSKLLLTRSDLTLASDAITVTGCYHRVDTQGGAATDNLATINGAASGQIIILQSVASSRDVTVKNGTGNIFLAGSDFVLDNSRDFIVLICTGGELNELCRSNNGA